MKFRVLTLASLTSSVLLAASLQQVPVPAVAATSAAASCPAFLDQEYRKLHSSQNMNLCKSFAGKPMLIGHSTTDNGVTVHYQAQDPALTKLSRNYEPLLTWATKAKDKKPMIVSAGSALREPYFVTLSQDSSHMLVASPEIRSKETGEAIYLLAVIGSDLTVKWQHTAQVNVKAKTAEKLGPVGMGQSIEARAVVLLSRP